MTITQLQADLTLKDAELNRLQSESEGQLARALKHLNSRDQTDLAYECQQLRIGQ